MKATERGGICPMCGLISFGDLSTHMQTDHKISDVDANTLSILKLKSKAYTDYPVGVKEQATLEQVDIVLAKALESKYEIHEAETLQDIIDSNHECWACDTEIPIGNKYCQYHCDHPSNEFNDFIGKCGSCGKQLNVNIMLAEVKQDDYDDDDGYDERGYDGFGYDKYGYDEDGFGRDRRNRAGIHKYTGTRFNIYGRDKHGYNIDGYDKHGRDKDGQKRGESKTSQYEKWINDEFEGADGFTVYSRKFIKNHKHNFPNSDSRHVYCKDPKCDAMMINESKANEYERIDGDGYPICGLCGKTIMGDPDILFDLTYKVEAHLRSHGKTDREISSITHKMLRGGTMESKANEDYDEDGYDEDGYNIYGHDRFGRDLHGYDIDGYNRNGYNRSGYNRDGRNRRGRDRDGYDEDGYDHMGYNRRGKKIGESTGDLFKCPHCKFKTSDDDKMQYHMEDHYESDALVSDFMKYEMESKASEDGNKFDKDGLKKWIGHGYDRDGYDKDGYYKDGYDRDEFGNESRANEDYDEDGYDDDGYDKYGYNRDGHDEDGYDEDGYDYNGCNRDGYRREGYDKDGYDKYGRNEHGYDRSGYGRLDQKRGESKASERSTAQASKNLGISLKEAQRIADAQGMDLQQVVDAGNLEEMVEDYRQESDFNEREARFYGESNASEDYDKDGFDEYGYGRLGLNRVGRDKEGYDEYGYDHMGYNRHGINKNEFDKDGYDEYGFDKDGRDKHGYDYYGHNRDD